MYDLSGLPIKMNFVEGTADAVKNKKGEVISEGTTHTSRIQLVEGSNLYSIRVHSEFSPTLLELNLIERVYMVVVKIKNEDGDVGYVKVNANSLRKRLGFSEAKFKEIEQADDPNQKVLKKIHKIYQKKDQKVLMQPDETKYKGKFKNDKLDGQGTRTDINGAKYKGNFKDGKLDGQGTYVAPDGTKSKGIFEKGVFVQGTRTNPNGIKRKGCFKDGDLNGKGKYVSPNGTEFKGVFKNGDLIQGTKTNSHGVKYKGNFKNSMLNGRGTLKNTSGTKFKGNFKDGILQGIAEFTTLRGSKYKGNFKDGQMNGQGTYENANGKQVGEFKDGEFISGIYTSSEGWTYTGQFAQKKPVGNGTYAWPDGWKLEVKYDEKGELLKQEDYIIPKDSEKGNANGHLPGKFEW